jgi:site-specific recombinase XerD
MLRSEAFRLVRNRSRAMNDSTREISPLRQRMLEDLRLRKLAPKTQVAYIRSVRRLAGYLRRPPDTATVEDLRNFQLHLVDRGTSPITLNATITGLKFFFEVTLDRAELMAKMKPVFVPRTLPVVLSRQEVASLIAATKNIKHQTALSVAYGAGLRASEVAALKVGDVDSTRMTLRIQQGKGGKDRCAMLSPVMRTTVGALAHDVAQPCQRTHLPLHRLARLCGRGSGRCRSAGTARRTDRRGNATRVHLPAPLATG